MKNEEVILALDPGIGRVGYAILKKEKGNIIALDYDCIETSSKEKLETRLKIIYDRLTTLIDLYKPNALALEQVFFNNNQKTAIVVGQAQGVMILAAVQHAMTIHFVTPLQIKQALTGYGSADKTQVQKMVMIMLNLKTPPKHDDTADALACGITYLSRTRFV